MRHAQRNTQKRVHSSLLVRLSFHIGALKFSWIQHALSFVLFAHCHVLKSIKNATTRQTCSNIDVDEVNWREGTKSTGTWSKTFVLIFRGARVASMGACSAKQSSRYPVPPHYITRIENDRLFLPPRPSYGCRCPSTFDPVCGSNGWTFANPCQASCAYDLPIRLA